MAGKPTHLRSVGAPNEGAEIIIPSGLTDLPTRREPNDVLQDTLRKHGVDRSGLVGQLAKIAATGEKVTTTTKSTGQVVETVVRDPAIQLDAIKVLIEINDRADGHGKRRMLLEVED